MELHNMNIESRLFEMGRRDAIKGLDEQQPGEPRYLEGWRQGRVERRRKCGHCHEDHSPESPCP